jgi:hypothetical protein
MGSTGLRKDEYDLVENPGCSQHQNNFLSSYTGLPGDEYFLLVTNYNSESGFSLEWTEELIFDESLCSTSLTNPQTIHLNVFPNPTKNEIHCDFEAIQNESVDFIVMDAMGKMIKRKPVEIYHGKNSVYVSTAGMGGGSYFVVLEGKDGIRGYSIVEVIK